MAVSTPNQYPIRLSDEQRLRLTEITRNGHASAKKIRHAQVLLLSFTQLPAVPHAVLPTGAQYKLGSPVHEPRSTHCAVGPLPQSLLTLQGVMVWVLGLRHVLSKHGAPAPHCASLVHDAGTPDLRIGKY